MRRPLLAVASAYAAGIAMGSIAGVPYWWYVLALAIACAMALARLAPAAARSGDGEASEGYAGRRATVLVLAGVFTLGAFAYALRTQLSPPLASLAGAGRPVRLVGTVIRPVERAADRVVYVLRAEEVEAGGRTVPGRGLVQVTQRLRGGGSNGGEPVNTGGGEPLTNAPPVYAYGDRLAVRGILKPPASALNPGGFDYRAYLAQRGIDFVLNVWGDGGVERLGRGWHNPLLAVALTLRGRMLDVLDRTLPAAESSLLAGLILGARADLPDEVRQDFTTAGVFHILPTSYARKRESRIAT